jgi:transcriptional regulator with XRE-family HTH domain
MENLGFGRKLIEVRKAKGLTQEEVAEKCKITVRTIQRIESGIVNPRAFTIKIISDALGFDFFTTTQLGLDVNTEHQVLSLKKRTSLWWIKDLFNLKTHPMKKVSILTASFLMIVSALLILSPVMNAQPQKKNLNSITIQLNSDMSMDRIEVAFSYRLTFDSLVYIKNNLEAKGITINYRRIEFGEDNHLLSIYCDVDCNDGKRGGFGVDSLDYRNKDTKVGFYRDYSKNAKIPFGSGNLDSYLPPTQ